MMCESSAGPTHLATHSEIQRISMQATVQTQQVIHRVANSSPERIGGKQALTLRIGKQSLMPYWLCKISGGAEVVLARAQAHRQC
eukprot:1146161-Pelagomonas_calceolata.AAC.9